MPYLIQAKDHDGVDAKREELRQAHREHLKSAGQKLLASGALLSDDGATIVGGLSVLDTEDRAEAEKFANEDPYTLHKIRKEIQIIRWRRRWIDGLFIGDIA